MDEKVRKQFLKYQRDEMNAYDIYWTLGKYAKNQENGKILIEMAYVELNHANRIKVYTNQEVHSNPMRTFIYRMMAWLFGLTFVLKVLEGGESLAALSYKDYPELAAFSAEEEKHEQQLIALINERR